MRLTAALSVCSGWLAMVYTAGPESRSLIARHTPDSRRHANAKDTQLPA